MEINPYSGDMVRKSKLYTVVHQYNLSLASSQSRSVYIQRVLPIGAYYTKSSIPTLDAALTKTMFIQFYKALL